MNERKVMARAQWDYDNREDRERCPVCGGEGSHVVPVEEGEWEKIICRRCGGTGEV